MTKEEKEKRKLEKQRIKQEKKAQKLARKEEKRIAKLKKRGLYIEPEPPKEEAQEEVLVEEVQERVEETPQEEPQTEEKEEENVPEPVEEAEEKPVQKKRKAPKQYHISLRVDNKWQLKFGGSSKALKLFDTQKEAIEYAKPLAAKQKAALVIHRTDGKIRKQDYTKK